MEAWALAMFMLSAATFGALLESTSSPVRGVIADPAARRALAGLAMGLTAVALFVSPWGRRSGAHMNPAVTLGFLLLVRGRGRWAAIVVPVLWCLTTALTQLAMSWPDFGVPLLAAAVAVVAAAAQNRRGTRRVSTESP